MRNMYQQYGLVFCLSLVVAGCSNGTDRASAPAGFEKMAAPQTEYSELGFPGPAVLPTGSNEYVLPKDHGFVFLKGEKPLEGNVHFAGQITDVSEGKVVLSAGKDVVTMLYKLPMGQQLAVKAGVEMSISFTRGLRERVNDFMMVDSADKRLQHASGRVNRGEPVRIVISPGLEIFQESVVSGGIPPVKIRWMNKTSDVGGKGAVEVDIDGQKYNVLILQSMKAQTEPGGELTTEWQGFYLEYTLVRK